MSLNFDPVAAPRPVARIVSLFLLSALAHLALLAGLLWLLPRDLPRPAAVSEPPVLQLRLLPPTPVHIPAPAPAPVSPAHTLARAPASTPARAQRVPVPAARAPAQELAAHLVLPAPESAAQPDNLPAPSATIPSAPGLRHDPLARQFDSALAQSALLAVAKVDKGLRAEANPLQRQQMMGHEDRFSAALEAAGIPREMVMETFSSGDSTFVRVRGPSGTYCMRGENRPSAADGGFTGKFMLSTCPKR